jgi:hypothetical protein
VKNLLLIVVITFAILSCKKGTEPEEVKEENVPFEFMDGNDKRYFFYFPNKAPFLFGRSIISKEKDSIDIIYENGNKRTLYRNILYDINYLIIRNAKDYDSLSKINLTTNNSYFRGGLIQNTIDSSKKDSLSNYLSSRKQFLLIVYQEGGGAIISKDNCKGCLNWITEKLYLTQNNNNLKINITHRYHYRAFRDVLTPQVAEYALLVDNRYFNLLDKIVYNQQEVYYEDPKE